jgi:exopolysaccharide biosynthesis polyprenyl glycosylphosphotransferase
MIETTPKAADKKADQTTGKPRKRQRLQLQISERRLLLMFGDALAIIGSVLISLRIWSIVGSIPFDFTFVAEQAYWFFVFTFIWFTLAAANDFYNLRITSSLRTSFSRLMRIEMQLLVVYLIIFFLSPPAVLPRLFVLYHAVASFVLIGAWRAWKPFLIGWVGSRRRALLIGAGRSAETMLHTIASEAGKDYEIVGCVMSAEDTDRSVTGRLVLGTGKDLPHLVDQYDVAELIVAYGRELPGDVFQGLMSCYEQGVAIVQMPILYEQITGRVPVEHVGAQQWAVVLPIEGRSLSFSAYMLLKRLLDVSCAIFGLIIFAFILPPFALLMRIDSPGPLFYRQERVGRGGRLFKVIKLRTMIPDAEKHTGAVWATENDPRITRIGRILRKTRLDEVPQLVNVLRGEMSIVGPRPERQKFVDELTQQIPFYRTRLVVNPGLTGWAQVCYRYGNSVEDALVKLQYDLYYIRHQSITLDIMIMVRTVSKILAMSGT